MYAEYAWPDGECQAPATRRLPRTGRLTSRRRLRLCRPLPTEPLAIKEDRPGWRCRRRFQNWRGRDGNVFIATSVVLGLLGTWVIGTVREPAPPLHSG